MAAFKTVKGFRDFFPEDIALRNFIFDTWRRVARRYGFVEYEAPFVESTDLYRRKSGEEIVKQLFCFKDKADREISLRPEVTPSLARMAAARQRDYRKPLKWFQIGSCFRYEEPQEGRTREFIQFNADILGDGSVAVDAELVALSIDVMREFGATQEDFVIRLSTRELWKGFLDQHNIAPEQQPAFLQIIDKIERARPDETETRLAPFGISLGEVRAFMDTADSDHPVFAELKANLTARGLWDFIRIDATIVRGLAYYTGTVFEVFDLKHDLRAVAGGGRYDQLCSVMSGGAVDMPAAGFAMGDVVLGILLSKTPGAQFKLIDSLAEQTRIDVSVIIADETKRLDALAAVQTLRAAGLRVDYSFNAAKMNKQFQSAEAQKARAAVIFGNEYPQVAIKDLANRQQTNVDIAELETSLLALLKTAALGPLVA
ncbi:MAG: histidine--tRNA ligase [Verrucomicrobiaceae bacterium]|nr:histidine--tRNA ligase [Verrucomicrobiaceae bacterium]